MTEDRSKSRFLSVIFTVLSFKKMSVILSNVEWLVGWYRWIRKETVESLNLAGAVISDEHSFKRVSQMNGLLVVVVARLLDFVCPVRSLREI